MGGSEGSDHSAKGAGAYSMEGVLESARATMAKANEQWRASGVPQKLSEMASWDAPWSVLTEEWVDWGAAKKIRAEHRLEVLGGVVSLAAAQSLLSPFRRRAFGRNLVVLGVPAVFVFFPDYAFAAALDWKKDAALDRALEGFPPLRWVTLGGRRGNTPPPAEDK
uniref:Uncharacterized protein n=1 Tax=Hemiselmis andersenii TaxID=464988 RepID=A0A7S1EJG6_HEMAN|mmetsp:Transcript_49232/g.119384  ORF Transcript_49232/g.119384 Transcript_49232/m.119384 type:complete len:165 (+) Transcript_49232:178-672(+)